MLRFLPLLVSLVLLCVMLINPFNIKTNQALITQLPTKPATSTNGVAPDGQNGDYNLADILTASGDFDTNASDAVFNNQPVEYPKQQLSQALDNQISEQTAVLGTTTTPSGDEKWIEVDLAKQQLTAWEGNKVVKQFLISSGLWDSTHRGTFFIWYKTRSQRMKGGSKELGTYYDLPNVPNNMFYEGDRALHGAYWHHNFGHPMSHGCVNEPLDEAAWMFDWAGPVVPPGVNVVKASDDNPGTRVFIH